MTRSSRLEIEYCRQCGWPPRAGYMAQELLTTFEREFGEVALVPGSGGIFEVRVGGETIWSRHEKSWFPEPEELKVLIGDRIAPGKALGQLDSRTSR